MTLAALWNRRFMHRAADVVKDNRKTVVLTGNRAVFMIGGTEVRNANFVVTEDDFVVTEDDD